MDTVSLDDLTRIEPPEKPPSLEQLQQLTGNRFSLRWLKYTYNRFKNVSKKNFFNKLIFPIFKKECPTGRMHFTEFRRLFGGFLPDRLNDNYLERVFHAFCRTHQEQLSFKDMVVTLSKICDESPESNAEWIMRLINRNVNNNGQISYKALLASAVTTPTAAPAIASFVPFVGNSKRESSSPDHEFSRAINRRAFFLFEVSSKTSLFNMFETKFI
ncbi:unnamed protein product [Meloidogyne enterolobii]|uniref:Uncharacterized protein n=2 Tax=Meloidogyne enterolobii TaxID=390850 RepID=A0ACB0XN57_MELEN